MFTKRHWSSLVTGGILTMLVSLCFAGCGGATIESVCGKCTKAGDACVAEYTATQAIAKQKGCEAQFQAVLDCLDGKATCDDSTGELSGDACAQETLDLGTCTAGMTG